MTRQELQAITKPGSGMKFAAISINAQYHAISLTLHVKCPNPPTFRFILDCFKARLGIKGIE